MGACSSKSTNNIADPAEEPPAEDPKDEAAAEEIAAEEGTAEAADEMPPPTEPVKSSSILGQVVDYLSGRKSEPAVEETEAVETAEADAPAAETEQPVARALIEAVDAVAERDDAEQEEARVEWRAYALSAGEAGLAREMSVTPEELAEEEPPTLIQKLSKAFSNLLPAPPKCMPARPALDEEPADAPASAVPAAAQWGTKRISQQHWK
ncbi:hypothetical protein EMIHUDRAFT_225267 [Emiliania huxleyi CCMP1516]|uniref:Uncharacterized protein n=2 Tax=Emiliania huxleyi TaxID=2903 RepID=A0A0D3KPK0_EMIH1|nr:hypothetical protein EMIHUDRAFT_225267 [Emiliania huxleyi CCMP1516]EOD37685.1 hypothetical protein EMIHUDRAFT_225267 [Emiliania huxleyi CCMP1516]|eukprot:XP_005790114.1 hypothetical protein EMIHUDRAFT_225267 [Emiliania huxleyi CCMP1516]